jgi:hypothetical protein
MQYYNILMISTVCCFSSSLMASNCMAIYRLFYILLVFSSIFISMSWCSDESYILLRKEDSWFRGILLSVFFLVFF